VCTSVGLWAFQEPWQLLQGWGNPRLWATEFWGCLPGANFQEPQELLQSWENKAVGSRSPGAYLLLQATKSHSSCCRHWGTKSLGSRSHGACLPGMGSRKAVQQHFIHGVTTLLSSVSPGACLLTWATRSHGSCC
jgi:hypothetical protein